MEIVADPLCPDAGERVATQTLWLAVATVGPQAVPVSVIEVFGNNVGLLLVTETAIEPVPVSTNVMPPGAVPAGVLWAAPPVTVTVGGAGLVTVKGGGVMLAARFAPSVTNKLRLAVPV
jgi:hypothetical protein